MKINLKFTNLLMLFSLLLVFFSGILFLQEAHAQSLTLQTPKNVYRAGDSFQASLILNTESQAVNTVSVKIAVPPDLLQILDVRYGNSILTLWVETPKIDYSKGEISFTGGVPGGYNGSSGHLLSLGLKAKKTGSASLVLRDVTLLANDGLGTKLENISAQSLLLTIQKPLPPPPTPPKEEPEELVPEEIYEPAPDTTPPDDFIPLVSRDSAVSNNKYFVSFFAVDKDTGISHYEIREEPFFTHKITIAFDRDWVRAETPYVLHNQWWRNRVIVRAYDQAGNYREKSVTKPFHPYVVAASFLILIVLVVISEYGIIEKYFAKKREQKVRR